MGGNAIGQVRLSAMNINGLPDPFNQGEMLHPGGPVGPVTSMNGPSGPNTLTQRPQATHHAQPSIYSSQESLRSQVSVSRSNPPPVGRPGAGTPQFQNLSGVIRNPNSRGSLTNLNQSTNVSSSNYAVPSRSMSGSNLHHLDHHRLIDSGGSSTSSHGTMEMNQTPSPSDSAVGDLETVLKEKDTEINYLRETMEQNEQVIFKVNHFCQTNTNTHMLARHSWFWLWGFLLIFLSHQINDLPINFTRLMSDWFVSFCWLFRHRPSLVGMAG